MDKGLKKKVAAVAVICAAALGIMFLITGIGSETGEEVYDDKITDAASKVENQAKARANEIESELLDDSNPDEAMVKEIETAYIKTAEYINRGERLDEEDMLDILYNSALIFSLSTESADPEAAGKLQKTLLYKFSSPAHNISVNYLEATVSNDSSYEKGFEDDLDKAKQLIPTINKNKEEHITTFLEELAKASKKNDER